MFYTVYDDVIFIERTLPNARVIQKIDVSIEGLFIQAQLKNLNDVKREMAARAKGLGANVIMNFQYGQKDKGWLSSIFIMDDIAWYGRGIAAKLTEEEAREMIEKKKRME